MLSSLNKVVVCLDHSSIDKSLIENACQINSVSDLKEIIFLNVIKDFNLPEAMKKEFPDLIQKAIDDRYNEMVDLVKGHFDCDVNIKYLVKQGSEAKEVLKVIEEQKSDLVILGKKRKSESVFTTRVARRSPCNLLFIPENVKIKFDKIMVPVDFSEYSFLSLSTALKLTDNLSTQLLLENVYHVPSSYRYSGKSYGEFAEVIKGHAKNDLDAMLKKVEIKNQKIEPIFTIDKSGNVIDIILQQAEKNKVDLIIMGAKGRTTASALFIGSKSERMIRSNYDIPLMIIRKKGAMKGIIESLQGL
ncbi:MAG: universal stress protein [Bacteroidota bacterium]